MLSVSKLKKRVLENLLSKALKFIYTGENERPIRSVNFRDKSLGGLGLVNPVTKAKALLIKSMHRQFMIKKCNLDNVDSFKDIYGYTDELVDMMKAGVNVNISRFSYRYLNEINIIRNNSLIPSRSEKRVDSIKWSIAWQNWRGLRGVDAEELAFSWKLQQDLLPLGSRIHRPNAERRCLVDLEDGNVCQ